jgi:hypothetical protein
MKRARGRRASRATSASPAPRSAHPQKDHQTWADFKALLDAKNLAGAEALLK